MNRPRVLGYVLGLHHVPNSLPDHPFPSFRVFGDLRSLLRHCLPSLGVEAEPLGLVSCLVEADVVSAAATSQCEGEFPGICGKRERKTAAFADEDGSTECE